MPIGSCDLWLMRSALGHGGIEVVRPRGVMRQRGMTIRTRATRLDVARLAGVSSAVVSYVVNNGPKPVAATTRHRVLEAIRALDYYPDEAARRLRGVGGSTIGYLVPDIRNPFFADMTAAFNRALRLRGYHLLLADLGDDDAQERSYLELFRTKRVDGVIAWQTASVNDLVDFLTSSAIPFVLVAARHPGASSIMIDEEAAANLAVGHLKALGHRRIAYVGPRDVTHHPQSRRPFVERALRQAGLPVNGEWFVDMAALDDAPTAARRLATAPGRPTAAIVHNDAFAIRIVSNLIELGSAVPGDLSIVGYDDLEASRYTRVPLTSIGYSKSDIGRLAIDLLLRRGEGATTREELTLPVALVVRASSARAG
ncbi:LacI family transcriptional regulator [Lichenibacterium ramalinae]|uniref:LacI family transcriptional regulator n=1 Tax=Lichenibacterium ramalinae TaxID=2316527 RepID=A0A4Q2R6V7_9HYPH|nr:LacI family transcriptional regulator [Lichenibacterium ramalinae]